MRTWIILAIACVVTLALLGRRAAVADAPAAGAQRWEYTIWLHTEMGAAGGVDVLDGPDHQFASGKDSFKVFYQKVGGGAGEPSMAGILSLMGAKGWELVQIAHSGSSDAFYFKRPSR